MERMTSYTDYGAMLEIINAAYPIRATRIHLHRDLIGRVYFIEGMDRKAVLKLYRPMDADCALRTTKVLEYLRGKAYPAASVIRATDCALSILVDTPEGPSVAVLSEYVDGTTPDIKTEIEGIGAQVGRLHSLMESYPCELPARTKAQYIDDYIDIMRELNYAPARVEELATYGDELWARLQNLPRSFCHGDMHTGNMLQTEAGRYVLFDFDEASSDWPVIDVAYLSDSTNFNDFDDRGYDDTMRMFGRFYRGYSQERLLCDAEIRSIPDIIAVRHYTIIARIVRRKGLDEISERFLDEQYDWLRRWRRRTSEH